MAGFYLTRKAMTRLSTANQESRRRNIAPRREPVLVEVHNDVGSATTTFEAGSLQNPSAGTVDSVRRPSPTGSGKFQYEGVRNYFASQIQSGTTVTIGRESTGDWFIVSADC